MPKRISKKLKDPNQIAAAVVALSTGQDIPRITVVAPTTPEISRVMSEMGRKGGKIGGKRSLETMSPAQRKKRAKTAAKARWKPKK